VSLNLSYAALDMEFFPETSARADLDGSGIPGDSPGDFFFGMEMDSLSAVGYGLRLGFLYERGPMALGGTYSTKTELDFENGTNTLNLSAMGLGKVVYDAEMTNFAWPQQVGLGAAYRIRPSLLIAADLDWLEWSDAIATPTIRVTNPDHPMAPPAREIPFQMDWQDQWVWAVGLELTPTEAWAVRLGYNYGASPIPDERLRPLFPAIAEDHLTGGAGFTNGPWTYEIGMEYALEASKTNNSLDPRLNPFGPGCRETLSQFMAHFMVRRTLSRGG
jgi:long-chain fatty acid transport protein